MVDSDIERGRFYHYALFVEGPALGDITDSLVLGENLAIGGDLSSEDTGEADDSGGIEESTDSGNIPDTGGLSDTSGGSSGETGTPEESSEADPRVPTKLGNADMGEDGCGCSAAPPGRLAGLAWFSTLCAVLGVRRRP